MIYVTVGNDERITMRRQECLGMVCREDFFVSGTYLLFA
jgi:hypothetical protein